MKVKLDDIVIAIRDVNEATSNFYDREEQQIITLDYFGNSSEENQKLANMIENDSERYLSFPSQDEIRPYDMMEDFIETLPPGKAEEKLAEAIIGKGAFRRFKDTLYDLDLSDSWYKFQDEAYRQLAIDWCEENNLEWE